MTASGVRTVRAANPSLMTLDGTRTFIVGHHRPAVIDPGPASDAHVQAILRALGGARPIVILLTHAHADHAGAADLLREHAGAPIAMADLALRSPPFTVDLKVHEGDIFETDAGVLAALHTPGHTPEHFSFIHDAGRARRRVFVGDLLMGEGDTALVADPEGDVADYLTSLERVGELGASILHPAHGPPLEDPAAAIARFRAHRIARVRAVEEELGRGNRSVDEIVPSLYGSDLDPSLAPAAAASVAAMIAYLRSRG